MKLWTVHVDDGAVSIVSRPLGDELLFSEMEEIRGAGVGILVSMLDRDDLLIPGLIDEELAAPVAGLRFFHIPTPDQAAPPSDGETLGLLRTLGDAVRGGEHVAVHCHAGHGRSPAFAAAVLVSSGFGAEEAMAALSLVRRETVPHRDQQRDWVRWVEQQLLGDQGTSAR